MKLAGRAIVASLPPGWEGQIDEGFELLADGAERPTVVHLANFPLPPGRGDFAGGAIEIMRPGDALVVLYEYGPESVGTALFSPEGIPRSVELDDFGLDTLHHQLPGASGVQRFFTHAGRAFCLYVVVGSHRDRADVMGAINTVLAGLEIGS
jgi:hypothetical protein